MHRGLITAVVLLAGVGAVLGRTVRVGVYQNEPKVFLDEKGRPSGLFIGLLEAIAIRADWQLEYVPGDWSASLAALESGEIDLMPDVAYSPERAEKFDFHKIPVLESWSRIYASPKASIKALADLNGKRIAVLEGSIQEETFRQLMAGFGYKVAMIPAVSLPAAFQVAAEGRADAAVANHLFGDYFCRKYQLKKTAIDFLPASLFFAVAKGRNQDLLEQIDHFLRLWQAEPGSPYYTTLGRWREKPPLFPVPRYLLYIGVALVGLLGVSFVVIVVFRRQVRIRTRHLEAATAELTRLNRELEERVQARTRDLREALEQAQAADRLKSVFLATMSHELRTPLNSIIGFTGVLLQELAGPLAGEQRRQLNIVQESARHLLALINDVLDISKIEAGQLELKREVFDVRAAIERAMSAVAAQAAQKNLQLTAIVSADAGRISSDRRRVEQVLLNLLSNAVKFTEHGEIVLRCHKTAKVLEISVQDTGIGIRHEDLPRLFTPFHQLDNGLTRRHDGTGLGLAICKNLVSLLGGEIRVESEYGRGSTFAFTLPLAAEEGG